MRHLVLVSLLVVAACRDKTAPVADAPAASGDAASDALGAPTAVTVLISGPNASIITVRSSPAGIDCGPTNATCTASFPSGSSVTLSGTTDPPAICFSWMFSACPPGNPGSCTFTLRTPITVTVNCASAAN